MSVSPQDLVDAIHAYAEAAANNAGSPRAIKPGHRVKFQWPPHPVGRDYNVHHADYHGRASFQAYGEQFEVLVAETKHGVFGRCEALWLEAMGKDERKMLRRMAEAAEPLFKRQMAISRCLGLPKRFSGSIRDLQPIDVLKLLYCDDRDVANSARIEIETHTANHLFTPALIAILRDRRHPNRRTAHWCVLDLFEDLRSYVNDSDEEQDAVDAIKGLMWDAEDDYARAVFKAGTVVGGHLNAEVASPVLIECLGAPSRIGRRAAIHGLFHVVEWLPDSRQSVVSVLRAHLERETDPQLKEFAASIADDLAANAFDHRPEPIFPDEP
jgi:hypothetical protein